MSLLEQNWDPYFDEDYFENGIEKKLSLYENFRWLPEVSIPMACEIRKIYRSDSILDFGCAKGFLVRALRILGVEAYGYDISKYALKNAHPQAKQFLYGPDNIDSMPLTNVIFAKDTLEHISCTNILKILKCLAQRCQKAFFIVPFGDNGKYRISEYEKDASHLLAENEQFWETMFAEAGFLIIRKGYDMTYFKNNWNNFKKGNGLFHLLSRDSTS